MIVCSLTGLILFTWLVDYELHAKYKHVNLKSNEEFDIKEPKSTNVVITWIKLMVWVSMTRQNSRSIKKLLKIDFFLE